MLEWKGLYLPEGEKHLQEWMQKVGHMRDGKHTYQYHKYEVALQYTKQRRLAIDIGAHAGLWSRVMVLDFEKLLAFEPVPEHAECWRKNLSGVENAELRQVALGTREGVVQMHTRTKGSSGDTSVACPGQDANAATAVPLHMLDVYGLQDVDFIKIDNEGYEYYGLCGAVKTLLRCKPTVIVEQKPGMAQRFGLRETQAVEFLQELGAKLRTGIQGDYILSWDK